MKRILTTFCSLMLLVAATFAFESYKDSTILSSADILACNPKGNTDVFYKNWTLYDARGFEYPGYYAVGYHSNKSTDQYIQLMKWSEKDDYGKYGYLKLPEINYPIEEVTLTISSNQHDKGETVDVPRYIYFIKENRPGKYGEEADTASANIIDQATVTGLSTITLKAEIPTATTGYIVVGDKGGFRIWDIKIKWTVDKELTATGVTIVPEKSVIGVDLNTNLTVKYAPVNATTRDIVWTSLNEDIATVDSVGQVKGIAAGTAQIVATIDGLAVSDTCEIEVRKLATSINIVLDSEPIDSLQLEADTIGSEFDTETLEINFQPDDVFVENITWTSTQPSVATVNAETGIVTAVSKGTTLIIAESEFGLKDTCVVWVVGKKWPETITLNKHILTFEEINEYEVLTATVGPDYLEEDLKEVSWTSTNEKIATVSKTGTVIAKGAGTTWVVAGTYNGLYDSCMVIVGGVPTTGEFYVKVTATPETWAGKYLIVCEEENVALNGGLSDFDVAQNTITVDIDNSAIAATATTNAASFEIAAYNTGYSIKGNGGKFTGYNAAETQYQNKNGIQTSATALLNTIALDASTNAVINGADGSQLMYNTDTQTATKLLFRYYANPSSVATLKPIQLYRYVGDRTAVKQVEIEGVEYYSNRIYNSNNQTLSIYTVSGILMCQSDANVIDLTNYAKGVYVVKSTNGLLKIVR